MASPSPALILFARGVIARLAIWETLALAVQESWGGPGAKEKRTWMAGELVDLFEEKHHQASSNAPEERHADPEDVEDMLLQIMVDEFEVHVEDGSAEVVGKDIVNLWNAIMGQAKEGESAGETMILSWESRAERMQGRKVQAHFEEAPEEEGDEEGDWEDEDDEGMDEDEPPQLLGQESKEKEGPQVDEDGFTLVTSKRRK